MSNNNQKAIIVLCGAAAATALYICTKGGSGNEKDPAGREGGNEATAKVENPKETLAAPAESTTTAEAEAAATAAVTTSTSPSVESVVGKETPKDNVAPMVEKKSEPTKEVTNIVASSPISTQTPGTIAMEEESVGSDENKKPAETKNSKLGDEKTISSSLKDTKSSDNNDNKDYGNDDAIEVTATEMDSANGDDSSSNPAVDVSAILKARKNAAKNGKGKTKNTAASAAIKELKNSQQQQGKNKKKKPKNRQ